MTRTAPFTDLETYIIRRAARDLWFESGTPHYTSPEDLTQDLMLYALGKQDKIAEWREQEGGHGKLVTTMRRQVAKLLYFHWREAHPWLVALLGGPDNRAKYRNRWDSIESYKLGNPTTASILKDWYHTSSTYNDLARKYGLSSTTVARHVHEFEYDQMRRSSMEESTRTRYSEETY